MGAAAGLKPGAHMRFRERKATATVGGRYTSIA
jgi:hypothetical protein